MVAYGQENCDYVSNANGIVEIAAVSVEIDRHLVFAPHVYRHSPIQLHGASE